MTMLGFFVACASAGLTPHKVTGAVASASAPRMCHRFMLVSFLLPLSQSISRWPWAAWAQLATPTATSAAAAVGTGASAAGPQLRLLAASVPQGLVDLRLDRLE